ncbi:MAG: hypothetical protein AB8B55_14140 [Mariniblastus sp.]
MTWSKPETWMEYRIQVGSGLLVMIGFGFWLLWPMIVYDLARMVWWQMILFCVGDLTAIVFLIRWMTRTDESPGLIRKAMQIKKRSERLSENDSTARSTLFPPGRSVAIVLILSLLLDMSATALSLYSNYLGKKRAQPTVADVLSVAESNFRKASHYRINISYLDQSQNEIKTYIAFARMPNDPIKPEHIAPLRMIESKKKNRKLDVIFDPYLSQRVWLKDQTDETSVAVLSCIIHIFQFIGVLTISSELISKKQIVADPRTIYMLPIVMYAAAIVFLGFAIHHP